MGQRKRQEYGCRYMAGWVDELSCLKCPHEHPPCETDDRKEQADARAQAKESQHTCGNTASGDVAQRDRVRRQARDSARRSHSRGETMNSIMQSEKECYKTRDTYNLHKHHIFGGARRKASERHGCWVWLRADWHNLADYGVHFDAAFNRLLKAECQKKYEETRSRAEFMQTFGKNYL